MSIIVRNTINEKVNFKNLKSITLKNIACRKTDVSRSVSSTKYLTELTF